MALRLLLLRVAICAFCVICATSVVACNGPFLLMSGGGLEGEVKASPTDWSFAGDSGFVVLETKPGEPYSVNLAFTVIEGRLYLNAGDTETQWVTNMSANPLVRLALGGAIYELRAERVTNTAEIARFAMAWTDQSMFRRDPAALDEVWLYQLVQR